MKTLSFPVPGDLGAFLRETLYVAEVVIRRADGLAPQPHDTTCLPRVMQAAEATGRALGVDLRGEIAVRMIALGDARERAAKSRPTTKGATSGRKPPSKPRPHGKRAAAKHPA